MANLLTGFRLLVLLPVAWAMADPTVLSATIVLALIVAAILSDYFDGKVARARGTASARGMLFDHGTDFLFVTSCLVGAAMADLVPIVLPLLITIAFSQYVLDSYYLFRQKQLRMSVLGRWNGVLYFVPIVIVAVARLSPSQTVAALLLNLTWYISLALILSTLASIIDRGLAPLRSTE